jgi:hypothetical protein
MPAKKSSILMSDFQARYCSDDMAVHPGHLRETATKIQCPLNYLSTTSMGITWIEDKQKRQRKNIFPLVGSGTFLQYGIAAPS